VTLQEQVRYRGTLQLKLQSVTRLLD